MRRRTAHILGHLCTTGLLWLAALSAIAQNNPYKISDALYPYYRRASRLAQTDEGLRIADTLWHESIRLHDKKAQCLALTVPVQYYFNRDDEKLEQAAERLKSVSRQNGYLQYYYYGCSSEINHLVNSGLFLGAIRKAEAMREQAFRDDYPYGIYNCISILANIYTTRGNKELAFRYTKEALDYMLENMPEQDPSSLYMKIAEFHRDRPWLDYAASEQNLRLAEASAKTDRSKVRVIVEWCKHYYITGQTEKFRKAYAYCTSHLDGFKELPRDALKLIHIYHYTLEGNFDKAHAYADSMINPTDRLRHHSNIHSKAKEWEKAYEYRVLYDRCADSLSAVMQQTQLAELNAQTDNDRLKWENAELELRNTRLELEQSHSRAELERSNAENARLQLSNRDLEISRLAAERQRQEEEMEKQKALLERQRTASHYRITLFSTTILFLLTALIALAVYHRRRRRMMTFLQQKNEELEAAKEKAETADRMKSIFIQNMSHEIRTPLNAIVGFSQLIADPDTELEPEERQQFSRLIEQNSDLLTTLVNDILNISELESGKYAMNLQPNRCNELCLTALATVDHRKPEGVEMRFETDIPDDYTLLTDGKRVEQVLVNFLTNAEKYTTEGEILLTCSRKENPGRITLSVADTGCGIPKEQAETIFDRFQKLDSFKQGSGLGLNICRAIAERLQGEVRLDTSYTRGARFVFILPDKVDKADKTETRRRGGIFQQKR